jgi:hypothetical protein
VQVNESSDIPQLVSTSTQTSPWFIQDDKSHIARPILMESYSQTPMPVHRKDAECQTLMSLMHKDANSQTVGVTCIDAVAQTEVLDELPPFVYTDLAEDPNVRLH